MPPLGIVGVPKAGTPTFFTYEVNDLLTIFPGWANFMALGLIGLPSAPQYTADFCAVAPPEDVAALEDWGLLANPPAAIETVAYRRMGNTFRRIKWRELCEWVPPDPEGAPAVDAPTGWRILARNQVYPNTTWDDWHSVRYVYGPLPLGAARWGYRQVVPEGMETELLNFDDNGVAFFAASPPAIGQDRFDSTWRNSGVDGAGTNGTIEGWNKGGPWADNRRYLVLTGHHGLQENEDLIFDLAYEPAEVEQPPAPDVPAAPVDYPGTGPCETPSLGDLCRSLSAINAKIDYIMEHVNPPEIVAPDPPVPVVPVDPPPDSGPVPTEPIVKPRGAQGAVINVTNVPDWQPHYGTGAEFWPELGHVACKTAWGFQPSMLIKHRQLVLLNLPPQVEEIVLDLAQGVEAEVTWLYPPTTG
jgi:hypothetical protein